LLRFCNLLSRAVRADAHTFVAAAEAAVPVRVAALLSLLVRHGVADLLATRAFVGLVVVVASGLGLLQHANA
jgi:hypothetical protein